MTGRKGELTRATIDREWPHQVALPADRVKGANNAVIHEFCRGLSLCPRNHTVRRDDVTYIVFCFAKPSHAERFRERVWQRALRSRGSRSRQCVVPLAKELSRIRARSSP